MKVQRAVVTLFEDALVEQSPHGLDGIERNALGTLDYACPRRTGKAADEPVQQLAHDLVRERVERQVRDATAREHQPSALGPLRPGQHEEEDRVVPRPLEEVIEKVDQARVRPLQVLHCHHDGQMLRQSLEEEAPAREELFFREHLWCRQPEQLAEARGYELTVHGICDPALEAGSKALGDGLRRVLLTDLKPGSHHLRERPVAHALAVGQATPGVPEHLSGQAVDVLEELPGEA